MREDLRKKMKRGGGLRERLRRDVEDCLIGRSGDVQLISESTTCPVITANPQKEAVVIKISSCDICTL